MSYSLYRDKQSGQITLHVSSEHQLLKSYIESEVQEDVSFINLLIDKLKNTPPSSYELTGNSHAILITDTSFEIENHYIENEILTGPKVELIDLLEDLKKLLGST
jgi:uncharacterized protein YacL (UPF0231 family)